MTTLKRAENASRHWKVNAIFCIILVACVEKVSSRIRYRAVLRSDELSPIREYIFCMQCRQYNACVNAVSKSWLVLYCDLTIL